MAEKFDERQGEYNLKELKMNHSFALKMASIITTAVVSCILVLCFSLGTITPVLIGIATVMTAFFGIVVFSFTRGACLA